MNKNKIPILILLTLFLLASAAAANAQSADWGHSGDGAEPLLGITDLKIPWWTVDGGGGALQGGNYTLTGTIGQPEPGKASTGGVYTLVHGFWPGVETGSTSASCCDLYLPLVGNKSK